MWDEIWTWGWIKKQLTTKNGLLATVSTIIGIAGIPAALATAGVAIPVWLATAALSVVGLGTTVSVAIARYLPGWGADAQAASGAGLGQKVDAESPKSPSNR